MGQFLTKTSINELEGIIYYLNFCNTTQDERIKLLRRLYILEKKGYTSRVKLREKTRKYLNDLISKGK